MAARPSVGCGFDTPLFTWAESARLVSRNSSDQWTPLRSASRAHPTHGLADGRCRLLGVLVLPHSHRAPPCAPEEVISLGVSLSVPADFFRPVLRIGGRLSRMVGTPVPEAPVNEDRDTGGTKHEVGGASEISQRTRSHPVPQTESVHGVANRQLWPSVPAPVREHRRPSGR
jgi:hypothetical protein